MRRTLACRDNITFLTKAIALLAVKFREHLTALSTILDPAKHRTVVSAENPPTAAEFFAEGPFKRFGIITPVSVDSDNIAVK